MVEQQVDGESFEQFKKSFAYGSRTDLNFKFLAGLTDEEAADFFQQLLYKLGDTQDDGNLARIIDHIITWQGKGYAKPGRWSYEDAPLQQLEKPLAETKFALVTSTGHYLAGEDPGLLGVEDMSQEEAIARIGEYSQEEPELSNIPFQTSLVGLRVRHGGFDIRGVQKDPNVALPIDRLREFDSEGVIGGLTDFAHSFVGVCSQKKLQKYAAPRWLQAFKQQTVDAVILVPVWPVCHVSVGHAARILEAGGLSTVIIAAKAFRPLMEGMRLPRLLLTSHPMGRPLGAPGNVERQREVLLAAMDMLQTVEAGGVIREMPGKYTLL